MKLISEKLLSEILGEDVERTTKANDREIYYHIKNSSGVYSVPRAVFSDKINIHELAHKCKEWAFTRGYYILSNPTRRFNGTSLTVEQLLSNTKEPMVHRIKVVKESDWRFSAYSTDGIKEYTSLFEPEAIFKACEWIYDNEVEGELK